MIDETNFDDTVFLALKEELERAKQLHQEASESFRRISGRPRQLPRYGERSPYPDRALNDAASMESHAREAHLDALMRINEYLVNGTVPEHLKKPVAKETGSERPKVRTAGSY